MSLTLGGRTGVYDPIHQAEREDRTVRVFVGGIDNVATQTILTNTAFNIPVNATLYITQFFGDLETYSDECEYELVRCTGQNASGTVEEVAAHIHIFSAAAALGHTGYSESFVPAITVRYKDGFRSVAVRVDANDAAATVGTGWAGYWEVTES